MALLLIPLLSISPWSQSNTSDTTTHKYLLSIVDIDGKPVVGAKIEYQINERESVPIIKNLAYTDSEGNYSLSIKASRDPRYKFYTSYRTSMYFTISMPLYYPKNGKISSNYYPGNDSESPVAKSKVTLYKPNDYFSDVFLAQANESILRQNLTHLVNPNIIDGSADGISLIYRSIGIFNFKARRYINFSIESDNVFNSIKLNKYDIGKRIFDDVIRKILTPLNDNIADKTRFYGYSISVRAYTRNFADESADNTLIKYRFLIPANVTAAYKNADITGQQVLDSSIILMDDERIDLKLQ